MAALFLKDAGGVDDDTVSHESSMVANALYQLQSGGPGLRAILFLIGALLVVYGAFAVASAVGGRQFPTPPPSRRRRPTAAEVIAAGESGAGAAGGAGGKEEVHNGWVQRLVRRAAGCGSMWRRDESGDGLKAKSSNTSTGASLSAAPAAVLAVRGGSPIAAEAVPGSSVIRTGSRGDEGATLDAAERGAGAGVRSG
jgi:hypothetical protein